MFWCGFGVALVLVCCFACCCVFFEEEKKEKKLLFFVLVVVEGFFWCPCLLQRRIACNWFVCRAVFVTFAFMYVCLFYCFCFEKKHLCLWLYVR